MKKVTVSKEVAEAIQELECNFVPTDLALRFHVQGALTGKYAPLGKLTITELASALINGYEIKQIPENKLRNYYRDIIELKEREEYAGNWRNVSNLTSEARGVRKTLRYLKESYEELKDTYKEPTPLFSEEFMKYLYEEFLGLPLKDGEESE